MVLKLEEVGFLLLKDFSHISNTQKKIIVKIKTVQS